MAEEKLIWFGRPDQTWMIGEKLSSPIRNFTLYQINPIWTASLLADGYWPEANTTAMKNAIPFNTIIKHVAIVQLMHL